MSNFSGLDRLIRGYRIRETHHEAPFVRSVFVRIDRNRVTCLAASNSTLAGAAIGAGTGAIVAGPPGAVVGGVIGAVVGAPPAPRRVYVRPAHRCYFDADGYRRCRW
jgi:uncharacterized protein YcfJ